MHLDPTNGYGSTFVFVEAPIGIFDSGVGGLTVAQAIRRAKPDQDIIYFGDTAHLPYGDKSDQSIRQYSENITRFLLDKGCGSLVIACNTASALAYDSTQSLFPDLKIFNVIDPVVEVITTKYAGRHVGVIGTRATVRNGAYRNRIQKLSPDTEVSQLATPLLVPMIEEGFHSDAIGIAILESYMGRPEMQDVDVLVLGCTHYPLIKPLVAQVRGEMTLVDSAEATAREVKDWYAQFPAGSRKGDIKVYVSDYTEQFEKMAKQFFGEDVMLEEARI